MNNYFASLFNDPKTSDFVLVAEGTRESPERKLHVHTLILSACPFFKTYFETSLNTNKSRYVVAADRFDIVCSLLRYIYCRDVSTWTPDSIMDIVDLADEWLILEEMVPDIFPLLIRRWHLSFNFFEVDRICGVLEKHTSLHKSMSELVDRHMKDIPENCVDAHVFKYITDQQMLIRICFQHRNLAPLERMRRSLAGVYDQICTSIKEGKLDYSALTCYPHIELLYQVSGISTRWITKELPETDYISTEDARTMILVRSLCPFVGEKAVYICTFSAESSGNTRIVKSSSRFRPGRYYVTSVGYVTMEEIRQKGQVVPMTYPYFEYTCRFSTDFHTEGKADLYCIAILE